MEKKYIGLDIGGTKCCVLLAEVNHGIVITDKIRFATCVDKGFDYAWGKLCEGIDAILAAHQLTSRDIEAIGISCGGPLDARHGIVLCPPHLRGWVNIPLTRILEEKYGIQAFLQNDANACALVEWKLGAGRNTSNMIFLTMGTGMGGGMIVEDRLLCGHTDMGGEIGHLRLTDDGPVGFGKAGSVEGYTSGEAIRHQAMAWTKEMMSRGQIPAWMNEVNSIEELDVKVMADCARRGDEDAIRFWNHIGRMLGRTVAMLVDAFNPEVVTIGSIFVRCEELLRPAMEAELKAEAIPFSLEGLRVVPAQTGEAIGDLASIMVALYNLGIDPLTHGDERKPEVMAHYNRLFEQYPQLEGCRAQIMDTYLIMRDCYQDGGKLLICGEEGSCADGERIAGELVKGSSLPQRFHGARLEALSRNMDAILPGSAEALQQGLPAIALTQHAAVSAAAKNDCGAYLSMAQQTVAYGRKGDVLLGIGTSGNAKNVLLAIAAGKALGMRAICLTGGTGGRMAQLCDSAIIVPGNGTAEVQEMHVPICHTLCAMLEAKFFA